MSGYATTVSGSNVAYQALSSINFQQPDPVVKWAREMQAEHESIQKKHERTEKIKVTLSIIPKLQHEFIDALNTYETYLAGSQSDMEFGIKCRNFMEHLKGEWFKASQQLRIKTNRRTSGKRNKLQRWEDFADVLAVNGANSLEHQKLVDEKTNYDSLHHTLTYIAKNLRSHSQDDLKEIFVEWVDHTFSMLFLVDQNLLKNNI